MRDKRHALRLIDVLREELQRLLDESKYTASFDTFPFRELKEWKAKTVSRISREIDPFEGTNLQFKEVSTFPPGGLGTLFIREINLYKDFLDSLANHIESVTGSFMPTGWEKIDRNIEATQYNLNTAQTALDFQKIGLACRETLIDLGQEVFDADTHPTDDGTQISKTDAYKMLEAYIGYELHGSSNKAVRDHAKSALQLANALTHHRIANYREAALCLEATISVINVIAIISGQRDPS